MSGLSLCSWNANGLLSKIFEFNLFVEKYDPDILLLQETHLRPTHNTNIKNYTCYRNDRITDGPATGGTLIFIKNSIPHVNPPTPTFHHVEATTVTITPPNANPVSITSIYIPPRSDNRLFTLDLETILQINSNCVIFGDFNATHSAWNCSHNSTRGTQLKTFTDATNLEIAFPASHTRYGYNSSNTLDFALISNLNFPYTIESISELSSDHNPVMLSFNLNSSIHKNNSRAFTTCWSAFKIHLKNHFHLSEYANINSTTILENKIAKFTDAVSSAHSHASEPIKNTRHSYTPQHIKQIITLKNRARKLFQRTLHPTHKTEANRLQAILKREIKIHKQNTWATKLASLEPQDNSLWQMQKHFRKKRSNIPNLTSPSGIASTDEQKANLIANTFIDNYTENKRPGNFTTNIDSDVTNTIRNFFATPPSAPTPRPTNPVEISD
ncbi:probable RNA-directed DNA polymerase from transposon X-element [Trichonephila clavipes]|nr:probable RNA-directed DNA polymerase from transposon X-element [Trichonephila clavipes]